MDLIYEIFVLTETVKKNDTGVGWRGILRQTQERWYSLTVDAVKGDPILIARLKIAVKLDLGIERQLSVVREPDRIRET
jgi:hypothetical protein